MSDVPGSIIPPCGAMIAADVSRGITRMRKSTPSRSRLRSSSKLLYLSLAIGPPPTHIGKPRLPILMAGHSGTQRPEFGAPLRGDMSTFVHDHVEVAVGQKCVGVTPSTQDRLDKPSLRDILSSGLPKRLRWEFRSRASRKRLRSCFQKL